MASVNKYLPAPTAAQTLFLIEFFADNCDDSAGCKTMRPFRGVFQGGFLHGPFICSAQNSN